jgi:dTDP-4-dehydrorhamnose 3,5-epimerase
MAASGTDRGKRKRVNLSISPLTLLGIKLIRSARMSDVRGYFAETYVRRDFVAAGIQHEFIQDNESMSLSVGTIRGLHFQIRPFAQTKLVRVLWGRILDVVVDLRRSSPTYGRYLMVELSAESGDQLIVPVGFAHGFCAQEPDSLVSYKVDNVYSAEHERGVHWTDADLAIRWQVDAAAAIVSERDRGLPRFRDLPAYFD